MAGNLAVYVQNACKSYGKKEVLRNLCMHVPKGSIYGLLGSSGCGKTTLLSCIVGRRPLNSGDIWVLGGKPGTPESGVPGAKIGYMPQEIALVGEFTVKDAIYYFGRIFNMTDEQLEDRFNELSNLLDLPPEDRFIRNCSGGQQRRVSFAASMVHLPELLILDEPTVGVDPILRERIWDYLVKITTSTNMAVIITTHYIEEARQANLDALEICHLQPLLNYTNVRQTGTFEILKQIIAPYSIGLMRNGCLLTEESPPRLLQIFNTDVLEDVFFILSQRQNEGKLNDSLPTNTPLPIQASNTDISLVSFDTTRGSTDILTPPSEKAPKHNHSGYSLNKKRLIALLDKNWKQLYRNLSGLIFIIIFPIVQNVAFLLAVGPDPKNINIAIVNHESTVTFCPDFVATNSAVPYNYYSCHFQNMSCRFLSYIEDPMLHKVEYHNLSQAFDDVRHGKLVGVIYLAENFTESLEDRIENGRDAEKESISFSEIKVWLDMSNRQIGATIKYKLLSLYRDFQKDILRDCDFNPNLFNFMNMTTYFGDEQDTFTEYMTPGLVVTIMFFMMTLMTSQIIVTDRCEGLWDRSVVAGVSALEICLTHFIMQLAIVALYTATTIIITFGIFKINYVGSMWIILLITFLQGIDGVGYGFWISVVSYNVSMANVITTGSFYIMILLCGCLWPIEGMPFFLQYIAKCLPFTIVIDSFRNVMKKGWDLTNIQVLSGVGIEMSWIIILAVVNIVLVQSQR